MIKDGQKISVTYKTSSIGCRKDQKETIKLLGFKKLGEKREFTHSKSLRGMLLKVQHLIEVVEL